MHSMERMKAMKVQRRGKIAMNLMMMKTTSLKLVVVEDEKDYQA